MKELTHKDRSWRGPAIQTRTVTVFGWAITQVRQANGSWENTHIERAQSEWKVAR